MNLPRADLKLSKFRSDVILLGITFQSVLPTNRLSAHAAGELSGCFVDRRYSGLGA